MATKRMFALAHWPDPSRSPVSLQRCRGIFQEGVKFQSPHDGSELMLTPEKSIELQNDIGADIIMVRTVSGGTACILTLHTKQNQKMQWCLGLYSNWTTW